MSKEKGETQKAMEEKLEQINAKIYSEADLVSFGKYVLSVEREIGICGRRNIKDADDEFHSDIVRAIYDADLENWKESTPQF